jgi:hypothetical protein
MKYARRSDYDLEMSIAIVALVIMVFGTLLQS